MQAGGVIAMDRDELFKRVRSVLNPDVLRSQRVVFFGCGSGGARTAEESVRYGLGRVTLVDRPGECLEEVNIIRHPLGYRYLGMLKVEALRRHLLDINPECDIQAVSLDVAKEPYAVKALVRGASLVQLCTDNEASKHSGNAAAVEAGVPLVFAGVFDGGCGGEVGRVMPGDACYACMASYLNRSARFDELPEARFDYSNPDNEEYRSSAALNMDIAQIALIQARVGLVTLMERCGEAGFGPLGGNYVLFGNRVVPGLFPRMLHSEVWTIARSGSCLICGGDGEDAEGVEMIVARILASALRAEA